MILTECFGIIFFFRFILNYEKKQKLLNGLASNLQKTRDIKIHFVLLNTMAPLNRTCKVSVNIRQKL